MLAIGVVLATPLAGAFSMGVDASSAVAMKNDGAKPTYGQVWVGTWVKSSGWGGIESQLRTLRDNGVTPVIQWYYWGDSISPSCVQNGCDGRTKGDWDAMAKDMATRAKNIMGSQLFYVVLEPEFNKAGISTWETFDGYLENQAKLIRGAAPNADIIVGFGYWGGWDIFDRAVAASDMVGFMMLRGSTRDSQDSAINVVDKLLSVSQQLKSRWGKSIFIYDIGISTYGGWESVQEKALQGILAKRSQLDAAGVKGIVWRYVSDNSLSSGYFGEGEKYWGVKTSSGGKKPAYDELVKLLQGGSGATTPTTSTAPATSGSSSSTSFSGVQVKEWWVQVSVSGSISKVEARINGGGWQTLDKQSWGAYARSIHVLTGQTVEFRATSTSGATSQSGAYALGGGAASTPAAAPAAGGSTPAAFSGVQVKEWWVQVSVSGSISKVEARINGGGWQTLDKQSWGAYARSIHVLAGQTVEFRATFTSGTTSQSGAYALGGVSASSAAPATSSGASSTTFSGVQVKDWWVQVSVSGSISKVEARVNGGAWQTLDKQSWGAYARSIHVLAGQKVEFRATTTSGQTSTSSAYSW